MARSGGPYFHARNEPIRDGSPPRQFPNSSIKRIERSTAALATIQTGNHSFPYHVRALHSACRAGKTPVVSGSVIACPPDSPRDSRRRSQTITRRGRWCGARATPSLQGIVSGSPLSIPVPGGFRPRHPHTHRYHASPAEDDGCPKRVGPNPTPTREWASASNSRRTPRSGISPAVSVSLAPPPASHSTRWRTPRSHPLRWVSSATGLEFDLPLGRVRSVVSVFVQEADTALDDGRRDEETRLALQCAHERRSLVAIEPATRTPECNDADRAVDLDVLRARPLPCC